MEAVGLALAVFPLVISLLEHYQDSCEKLRDWVFFRREFAKLLNDLNREQIIFRQHVEGTLRSITDSEFAIMEMMDNAQDSRWNSAELTLRLKRKLCGDGEYDNYLLSIQLIYDNLAAMSDRLKRCGSSVSSRPGINTIEGSLAHESMPGKHDLAGPTARKRHEIQKQFRRLQFSIGRKRWQEQVVDLGRQIDRVSKLYVEAEALAPARQSRHSVAMHQAFKLAKRQASSLHEAINRAWACGCKDPHAFKLLMDRRRRAAASQRRSLTVSFPLRPRAWAMPEVSLEEGDGQCVFETTMVSSADSVARSSSSLPAARELRGSVSASSNVSSPSLARTISTTLSTAGASSTLASEGLYSLEGSSSRWGPLSVITVPDSLVRIKDLCQAIHVGDEGGSVGYLEDGQGFHHVFHTSRSFSFTSGEIDQVINLERILTRAAERQKGGQSGGGGTATPGPELSRRHRMSIALTLAYAVLEFYPTPWLSQFRGKVDVRFFRRKDGEVLTEHPFVLCEAAVERRQPRGDFGTADREADHSNVLLALGILIMELWFGQTIESRSFWRKYCDGEGRETEFTSLMAAMEWQKKAKDEGGVVLDEVVSRCIRGNFGLAAMNLNEAECVGAVHDHVVKPLEGLFSYCWPAA